MKDLKFKMAYTTDLIIFGIDSRKTKNARSLPEKHLSILLLKRDKEPFNNMWCLPGGFVNLDETSKEASLRVLTKETNLTNVYMQELKVSDEILRDPRGRVISVSYMSLIDRTKITEELRKEASWFDVKVEEKKDKISIVLSNEIDKVKYEVLRKAIDAKSDEYEYTICTENSLAFDHSKLIVESLMELRNKVKNTDIVFNLMPESFTIGELKQVYELLLNKKLINSAFRRVIKDKVTLTNEMIKTGGHRPSILCKYKENDD